jgi:hypothetical protein
VATRFLARFVRGCLVRLWPHRGLPADAAGYAVFEPVEARIAAEARARELLLRMLSPAQRKAFQRYGYFAVEVAKHGTFLILPSTLFNVLHVATGRSYCAVPRGETPLADLMLAQKLLLEHDPEQFFRVANERCELIPGRADERSLARRALQARNRPPDLPVRWLKIPLIPHEIRLP